VKPGDKAEQVRRLRHAPAIDGKSRGQSSSIPQLTAQHRNSPVREWLSTCYSVLSGKRNSDASAPSSVRMSEALIPGANTLPPKRLVVRATQ